MVYALGLPLGEGQFEIYLQTGWHALRYEGRGESLESFATLPTPVASRFGRATRWPGLVVFCLPAKNCLPVVLDRSTFLLLPATPSLPLSE